MKLSATLFFCLSALVSTAAAAQMPQAFIDHHTAQLSLDWQGSYAGDIPCASCGGIRETVSLLGDGRYILTRQYMSNKTHGIFCEEGKYKWLPGGSAIDLSGKDETGFPGFQVRENGLVPLTTEGKPLQSGDRLWILHKVSDQSSAQALYASYRWQLKKLPGYQFTPGEGGEEPYVIFHPQERGVVVGWDGCNRVWGSIDIGANDALQFPALVSTRMACIGANGNYIHINAPFIKALDDVRSFTWQGNILNLKNSDAGWEDCCTI